MAAENEATCESDPNFAVICGFLEKFGGTCGLTNIDFLDLQQMLENTHEVPQELIELHVKLLRKARKSVSNERWEKALINLCHSYCSQDAWEIERFGYKKARISSKLRILKQLLEMQFDFNAKFKNEINKMSASELRSQPLGRDKLGCAYWHQADDNCQVRVYKDDPDEETWTLVAKDREGVLSLISELSSGDSVKIGSEVISNEDSSSVEIEKPILDTGQNSSPSEDIDKTNSTNTNSSDSKDEDTREDIPPVKEIKPHHLEVKSNQDEESNIGLDLTIKPAINLRIKPIQQLLASKPNETLNIKDKYMREDKVIPSIRRAVDSADFDINNPDIQQNDEDDNKVEEQPVKKSKLCRPTLLNNRPPDNEVSEAIEEPIMIVKDYGNGTDNCSPNNYRSLSPIVGEVIEEAVFYVIGEGNGYDLRTGNETNPESEETKQIENKKEEKTEGSNSIKDSDIDKKLDNSSSPSKVYKLGTVIDVKTDHNKTYTPSKKISRWDVSERDTAKRNDIKSKEELFPNTGKVQTLISKWENISTDEVNSEATSDVESNSTSNDDNSIKFPETTAKQIFFFGPQSVGLTIPYSANINKKDERGISEETTTNLEQSVINPDNITEEIKCSEIKEKVIKEEEICKNEETLELDAINPDNDMPSHTTNDSSCDSKNVPYDNQTQNVDKHVNITQSATKTNDQDEQSNLEKKVDSKLDSYHGNGHKEKFETQSETDEVVKQSIPPLITEELSKEAPVDNELKSQNTADNTDNLKSISEDKIIKQLDEQIISAESTLTSEATTNKEEDISEKIEPTNIENVNAGSSSEDNHALHEIPKEVTEEPIVKKYVAPLGEECEINSNSDNDNNLQESVMIDDARKKQSDKLSEISPNDNDEILRKEESVEKKEECKLQEENFEKNESETPEDNLEADFKRIEENYAEKIEEVPQEATENVSSKELHQDEIDLPKNETQQQEIEEAKSPLTVNSVDFDSGEVESKTNKAENVEGNVLENVDRDKTEESVQDNVTQEIANKEVAKDESKMEENLLQSMKEDNVVERPKEDNLVEDATSNLEQIEKNKVIEKGVENLNKIEKDEVKKNNEAQFEKNEAEELQRNDKNICEVIKEDNIKMSEACLKENEEETISNVDRNVNLDTLNAIVDSDIKSESDVTVKTVDKENLTSCDYQIDTTSKQTINVEEKLNIVEKKADNIGKKNQHEIARISPKLLNKKLNRIKIMQQIQQKYPEDLSNRTTDIIPDNLNISESAITHDISQTSTTENEIKTTGMQNSTVRLENCDPGPNNDPKIDVLSANEISKKFPLLVTTKTLTTSKKESSTDQALANTAPKLKKIKRIDTNEENPINKQEVVQEPVQVPKYDESPTTCNVQPSQLKVVDLTKKNTEKMAKSKTETATLKTSYQMQNILQELKSKAKEKHSNNKTKEHIVQNLREVTINYSKERQEPICIEIEKNEPNTSTVNEQKQEVQGKNDEIKEQAIPVKIIEEEIPKLPIESRNETEALEAKKTETLNEIKKLDVKEKAEEDMPYVETKSELNAKVETSVVEIKAVVPKPIEDIAKNDAVQPEEVDVRSPCIIIPESEDEDDDYNRCDPLSNHSSAASSIVESDMSHIKENIQIKTDEDFEDSIRNVQMEEMQKKLNKSEGEIKTTEDFEDSIEVKKIKLSNTIEEKSSSPPTVRRTRAATRKLSQLEQSCDNIQKEEKKILEEPKEKILTLANFQLDTDVPSPPTVRVTRKRGHCSPETQPVITEVKRQKIKAKRTIDTELRKSIEMKKTQEKSSSEDDITTPEVAAPVLQEVVTVKKSKSKKKKGKKKAKKKSAVASTIPSTNTNDAKPVEQASMEISEGTETKESIEKSHKKPLPTIKKKTRLVMGLEIPLELEVTDEPVCGVRQSRRIAQIKIKEEAERRKMEEMALEEIQQKHKHKKDDDKDYKGEKKRKNKNIIVDDDGSTEQEIDTKKKKKKKRKHKDIRKLFDESNPWRSSSDSSTSDEEDEEEIVDYSDEDEKLVFKSDHEFSPESDLEDNAEIQPLKRARTVRKESDIETEVDDYNCQKCGKTDHPEWILLCDGCDYGWHCSCLRPPLLVIPEGDWYCPPCQHLSLIKHLQLKLEDFDKKLNKRELDLRRKERLAYVGISLDNVLPPTKEEKKIKRDESESESDEESESESEESSTSASDSDEPIYQLRQRRQAHSYRFNDYDELINSAIQDEMNTVKPTVYQSRGKDISTIINADKEENNQLTEIKPETEEVPSVVPKNTEQLEVVPETAEENPESDDDIKPVVKKPSRTKKHRRLNSLDISSDDDEDSDEDFKGNSSDEEDDDFDDEFGSESSDDIGRKRGGPIRRSTRARTSRYDKDFINDDDDSDEAPRKRKTRSIWDDESESEESDKSWGRRRRKASKKTRKLSPPKQNKKKVKKKKKSKDDSDAEVYRKKKPKIKYGGLDDEEIGRRTRGKKITYVDALGSDSDEETVKKAPPKIPDSEEEYVLNEDEEENEKDSDDLYEEEEEEDADVYQSKALEANTTFSETLKPNIEAPLPTILLPVNEIEATPDLVLVNKLIPPMNSAIFPLDPNQDFEEPNPIEEINKNVEAMDMEMMIEDEEYANKQLQLVAVQIEKERKRKEKEAAMKLEQEQQQQSLQVTPEPKIPKKRGRKPKNYDPQTGLVTPPISIPIIIETVTPIAFSGPVNYENNEGDTPKKRRGRGKGKKTLAAEAAAAAAAAASSVISNNDSSQSLDATSNPEVLQGGKLGIATPPQPFAQTQPTPSVITRMLQNQQNPPYANNPNGGAKFYGTPGQAPLLTKHLEATSNATTTANSFVGNLAGPRGVGVQFRPTATINYLPRGVQPNMPVPPGIPHIYHHPIEQQAPGTPGVPGRSSPSAVPRTGSPLSTKSSLTPPPPPYSRPQLIRFPPPNTVSPMTNPPTLASRSLVMGHMQSPRGRLSPHQSNIPPNYHFATFPPNINEDVQPTAPPSNPPYNNPPYDQFPADAQSGDNKIYEEDGEGEFGGLVSYFSSQREDDLDT